MDLSSSRVHSPSRAHGYTSQTISRNALIFGVAMLLLQVGLSLIYGFLVKVPSLQLNTSSVLVAVGLAMLVVAGFGLLFGYTRRLAWSGIGFTFFILAFSIEVYPLINDFWTKTGIQSNNVALDFSNGNKDYNIFLSDRETATGGTATYYGNSITNAIKCALSVAVAFSAVLGRAGHLECLLVSAFGVVGFELNRQIIQQNQGTDTFGTFYIFTFGGFMGLGLGLLSLIRERGQAHRLDRKSMKKYVGSEYSVLFAIFGGLIIFALFPLLAYQIDAYSRYNQHSPYTNPVSIIAAMGAGGIGAILTSLLINGSIIARDAIHGPIAGAIVCGASSLYITNPVYAFVAGCVGGISQAAIQNFIEKPAISKKLVLSTVSWSLFGMQGILGAGFAAGWKAITFGSASNGMTIEPATLQFTSQFQFYGGLISAGIGMAFGLVVGCIFLAINGQRSRQYFQDYYYWFNCDSIRYDVEEEPPAKMQAKMQPKMQPKPVEIFHAPPHEPKPAHKPQALPEPVLVLHPEVPPTMNQSEDEFDFSLGEEEFVNPYAYL